MRTLLGWILLVCVLFAQSAWAFEGHPGHFEAGAHNERPADAAPPAGDSAPSGAHCAHSPVHFVAVHREPAALAAPKAIAELPPYRGPVTTAFADPPFQPPRA